MGLLDWFTNKPPQPVAPAANALTSRQAYLDHVESAQVKGQQPMKYEEWLKLQKQPPK